jgi:glycosyltransferase involved in cell wall biosynthesis
MAKIQIITSDENGGANACEALWYEMAAAALEAGHEVSALVAGRSAGHGRIVELGSGGVHFRHRWSEPRSGRFIPLWHKIWQRTGARWILPECMTDAADFRILNVGTMIEAAREPWATLLSRSSVPYAVLLHSNSEIRDYPEGMLRKLRTILCGARRVYFVSERLRQNAEEQLLERLEGARVVQNPVNLRSREIETWPQDDGCLRMAVVGRLDAFVKGHVRLLHALADERWRARNWKLSLYGSGPDRKKIAKAIAFYGLTERVGFGGFVEDVRAAVWRDHHLLVMPSMLEGMPLTLVEAMVCGRPALCSDVGGASELIRDGVNGFLASSPFAKQLGEGLERVWARRYELPDMGRQAHDDTLRFLPKDPGARLLGDVIEAVKQQ